MKTLIKEFNKQTSDVQGDETFIFAFDNPHQSRGTGVVTYGNTEQQARLLAGIIDGMSQADKELLYSYLVVDDSETYIATAMSYIDAVAKE